MCVCVSVCVSMCVCVCPIFFFYLPANRHSGFHSLSTVTNAAKNTRM